MQKKITTVKAVAAYNYLKTLKVNTLSEETKLAIWKDIKALRPTAETYEKDKKDVDESLKDKDADKWEERRQKAAELEAKVNKGEYEYSADDIKEQNAVINYLKNLTDMAKKRMDELNKAEVTIDINTIKDEEMLKAISTNDTAIGVMDELSFLLDE